MNRNLMTLIIVGGVIAGFVIVNRITNISARNLAGGVVTGTAGAAAGAVEGLGEVTNTLSGGLLGRFGEFLGGAAADIRDAFILDDPTRTPGITGIDDPRQPDFSSGRFGGF